ncbi:hypothetical protein [Cohnella soli]|uniref:Uncharacterized protein n=1 Tax=Cohnella soli TaxID=425005 RepID=A0ABW0HXT4_9BACL
MLICTKCLTMTLDDQPIQLHEESIYETCSSGRCQGAKHCIRVSDPFLASAIIQILLKGHVPTAWSSGVNGSYVYIGFDFDAFAVWSKIHIDKLELPQQLKCGVSNVAESFETEEAMKALSEHGDIIVYASIPETLLDDWRVARQIHLCRVFQGWIDTLSPAAHCLIAIP